MTQKRWEADDIRVIGKLAKAGCSSAQILENDSINDWRLANG